MLVTARVDLGRRLRCGDDDGVGRISSGLYGRDVRISGSRILLYVSATFTGGETLRLDGLQQSHVVGRDCRRGRDAVLPTSLDALPFRKSIYSRHAADRFSNRRNDVTYVSSEG